METPNAPHGLDPRLFASATFAALLWLRLLLSFLILRNPSRTLQSFDNFFIPFHSRGINNGRLLLSLHTSPLAAILNKMGWFDGRSSSSNNYYVRRSPSRRSTYSTHHSRHSAPSFFGLGNGGSSSRYSSTPSIFSSSSRRARPRAGFVQRIIYHIKKLFRDIYRHARRHPVKVFLLVIVPLLTSGALPKLLAMIGLHLPKGLGGSFAHSLGSGGPRLAEAGSSGLGESFSGLMNIAKNFV